MRRMSWMVAVAVAVVAAGCGKGNDEDGGSGAAPSTGAAPGTGSTSGSGGGGGATVDVPSTDTEWSAGLPEGPNGPIPFIVVDQFGYRPEAAKVAVIRDPQEGYDASESFSPGTEYAVVDVASGDTVVTGAPAPWNGGETDSVSGDRVWWFDFSELTTPGTYYVLDVTNDRRSVHFRVAEDVYRSVLKHAVRSFYYQRAGQEKSAEHAGADWQDAASHPQDAATRAWVDQDNAATARDLSGGWYDAGDFNKYTSWTAAYVVRLLRAYERNPTAFADDYGIPESGNGVPDILDEVQWGIAWLIKMQLDDGSLLCVQGLDGASPPSAATEPSYYGEPTTNASLATAGAFAYASKIFGARGEAELAGDLLQRAVDAYSWANANPDVTFRNNDSGEGTSGLAAGQQEVDDQGRVLSKLEAAIYLFEQTGDASYRDFVDGIYADIIPSWGPNQWMTTEQEALLYYASLAEATASVASDIQGSFVAGVTSHGDQFASVAAETDPYRSHVKDYVWGSNRSKAAQGVMYQYLDDYNLDPTVAPQAVAAAEGFVHYLHGVNPLGLVYLTNMQVAGAEHSAKTLYHTWFQDGSARWDEVTATTPGPAPGLLVGGPNPQYSVDGCCSDTPVCFGAAEAALCSLALDPPLNQPPVKSYLQFNASWPANSWAVTENSNGYQSMYIQLLARYAR